MRLVLVRHGKAENRQHFIKSGHVDAFRPLSAGGRRDLRQGAQGLAKIVRSINVLATSPLVRAVETAAIIARSYKGMQPLEIRELRPGGRPEPLLAWLGSRHAGETVMLVGHEPVLSRLACYLLTGNDKIFLALKRGGACLLEFESKPAPGAATLRWSLPPRHLRRLSE